jgi:hypothetical protein
MLSNHLINYSTNEGIDYIIKFTVIEPNQLPIGIDIPVIDIIIETSTEFEDIKNSAYSLLQITKIIHQYALINDAIYYFYCSNKSILKSKSKENFSNQEFRSLLFSRMFEKNNDKLFFNHKIRIVDIENGSHYIHLISKFENIKTINLISEMINEFQK